MKKISGVSGVCWALLNYVIIMNYMLNKCQNGEINNGLCYAEFAARVPKAGSAYVYSYVTVGEFIAFVIGWNLILEYVLATASVARGLSNYIDALANNTISTTFHDWLPMDIAYLGSYPDFLAFFVVLLLTALLAFGVKESSVLNNAFTVLNLLTVGIVLVCGTIKADTSNWNIPQEQVLNYSRSLNEPDGKYGTGGFMPFGVAGVMAGAAKCFFGFVGFDAVATTGEEAKNPQKDIPLAIVISLFIIFAAYFGVSTVLTMMWPYYDQDINAPFPYVFDQVGWTTVKWIVTSGAVFALCTSMLGSMFPLPRVLYSMANDGIIFKPLGKIHQWTQTPILACVISGLFAGVMAMIFDLDQLIDMMSIGTLLAYTIVAVCVLILRYQDDADKKIKNIDKDADRYNSRSMYYNAFVEILNLHNNKEPNDRTSRITKWGIAIFSVFSILFSAIIINVPHYIFVEPFYCVGFIVSLVAMLVLMVVIGRQPVAEISLSFKVPLVPIIPCVSVLFNFYLMLELDAQTWVRFTVWLIIGFLMYFCYGIRNSVEGVKNKEHQLTENASLKKESMSMNNGSYALYNPE